MSGDIESCNVKVITPPHLSCTHRECLGEVSELWMAGALLICQDVEFVPCTELHACVARL